jgi:hypothetical protein
MAWFFLYGVPRRNSKVEYGWTVKLDRKGHVTEHEIYEGEPYQVVLNGGKGKKGQHFYYELAHYHPTDSTTKHRGSNLGMSAAPSRGDIRGTVADAKKTAQFFGKTRIPENAACKNGKYYHYVVSREGVAVIEYNPVAAKAGKNPLKIFFTLNPKGTGNSKLTKQMIARELRAYAADGKMPKITDAALSQMVIEIPWATRATHPAYKHFVPQRVSTGHSTSNPNGKAATRFYPNAKRQQAFEERN